MHNKISSKRILIDLTQIPKQKTGAGIYALNLIKEISHAKSPQKYFVTIQDDDLEMASAISSSMEVIKINSKIFRFLPFRLIFEQILLPIILLFNKIDIVHSLHYSFPLFSFFAKKIVTVHDLTFFKYPQFHLTFKRIYFKTFLILTPLFVNRIIVVSESTKRDLIRYTNTRSDRIGVIHLGCNSINDKLVTEKKINNIVEKYRLPSKFLLYLGMIEPRKNIISLLKAFSIIRPTKPDYSLVIAGSNGWHYQDVYEMVKQLNLSDYVFFTGYVKEEDKLALIKGSKIFIYPSIYEGFGLPVLEAMSLGVPTITGNGSSLQEIAGGGAILVDIKSPKKIGQSILFLLNTPKAYHSMSNMSKSISLNYSWSKTARLTMRQYNTM